MWYVIAEYVPGVIAYYGPFEGKQTADTVAIKVEGVSFLTEDWNRIANIINRALFRDKYDKTSENFDYFAKGGFPDGREGQADSIPDTGSGHVARESH